MNERERLIELILNAPRTDTVYGNIKLDKPVQTAQTIADYLLANGVIAPPCKVGDTVYFDGGHFAKHRAGEIMERRVDAVLTEVWATFRGDVDLSFDFKDFGKTVFLSRELAEKALAERSKQ